MGSGSNLVGGTTRGAGQLFSNVFVSKYPPHPGSIRNRYGGDGSYCQIPLLTITPENYDDCAPTGMATIGSIPGNNAGFICQNQ